MSTSAVIKVPGVNVFLYKHFDGYPKATLPWLEAFNHEFTKRRGIDPQYKMAQLVRSSVFMAAEFRLDKSCITGWGIVDSSIMGEYIYILNDDGSVTWKKGDNGMVDV